MSIVWEAYFSQLIFFKSWMFLWVFPRPMSIQNMIYMVRLSVDHVTKDIYNNRFRDFIFVHLFLVTVCLSMILLCFATLERSQPCYYTFHLFLNIVKAKKVILIDNKCQITLLFFILELQCYDCHFLVAQLLYNRSISMGTSAMIHCWLICYNFKLVYLNDIKNKDDNIHKSEALKR